MNILKTKLNLWGAAWGIVYGLVGLGFYYTPLMITLLGFASLSTMVALQNILFQGYRMHFALLGVFLVFETAILYLRAEGVKKLSITDLKIHRVFLGTLVTGFILTYFILLGFIVFFLKM